MDQMGRSTVFGLDVWSDEQLQCLAGARAPATGRVLDVLVDRRENPGTWPLDAVLISAQHERDGTPVMRIEAHEEAGFQLCGGRYGRHILSPDGRRLRCTPDGAVRADWERFVVAQVLPFAAALNGLEVMHASAVTAGGGALALLGPSGSGKTSLALALRRAGAGFLTDDVLAVERTPSRLIAHPGTAVAGVAHSEAARVEQALVGAPTIAVNDRERLVRVPAGREPAVLAGMLFLHRDAEAPADPSIERVHDARALLSATFNFVLDDPGRLERLLDVCADAARGPVARVRFGPAVDADRLAATVAGWFDTVR